MLSCCFKAGAAAAGQSGICGASDRLGGLAEGEMERITGDFDESTW